MKYVPDDRCIYCTNTSDSDEHVIPLGLNGTYVLPKASCSACRDVTSKFEMSLLRGSLAQLRVAHKFKTRRPKKQPTSFQLLIDIDGRETQVDASASQHPLILNMPLFPMPGLVSSREEDPTLRPSGVVVFHLNQIEPVLRAHSVEKVAVIEELQYENFARLLAKVAYGFLVGELGKARVKGDYLLPVILGEISYAGLYIGSSDNVLTASERDPVVQYHSYLLPKHLGGNQIAVVTIRLFPHMLQNPAYIVLCDLNESAAAI